MTTPFKIHFTWKNNDIPPKFVNIINKWRELHPNYEIHYYTDDDIDKYIDKFPQFKTSFNNMLVKIEQVDFFRYLILYNEGGVYSDLDVLPLKKIDDFVILNKIIIATEPIEHAKRNNIDIMYCNALMISPPKQIFWLKLCEYITDNYEFSKGPVKNTGPIALTNFINTNNNFNIEKINPCIFMPLTSRGISKECNIENSYTIHLWNNSWVKPWYKDERFSYYGNIIGKSLNSIFLLYILFILIIIIFLTH